MKLNSSLIDVYKFKRDFSRLYKDTDEGCSLLESLVERINESRRTAATFLRNIDSIENRELQKCCRMATIAQMYNAKLDYRSGYPYLESPAYAIDLFLLCFQYSTAVVSKYGELIIDEGVINTHKERFYPGFAIVNDVNTKCYGLISNKGEHILPCIFDYVDLKIGHDEVFYKNVPFRLKIYGAFDAVEKEDLSFLVETFNKRICCLSEDSILFSLTPLKNIEEAINDVKSLLSSLVISKERLQEIVEFK